MTTQPLILLTFSNDKDAYLSMIVEEQKAIKKALLDAADKNYLEVRDIQHASTEEFFYFVNRYHNQVRILHYGGHADGSALQLEKEIGVVQMANVKGIAGLLGIQKNLKLVFLNGCATKGQVKILLDKGVPAVIATSVSIKDKEAQRFAGQFYEALGTGCSIREAFLEAKAMLETEKNAPEIVDIESSRGVILKEKKQKLPWGLYWREETAEALDWTLPKESFYTLDLGANEPTNKETSTANSNLINPVLKAIKDSPVVKELAKTIKNHRAAGDTGRKPTDSEKKGAILHAFLFPISIQLRELFSVKLSKKLDVARLRKIADTYQTTMEFMAYIMLSDLWDSIERQQKNLKLKEDELLHLKAFFYLNAKLAASYNYFLLADVLLKIAKREGVKFYINDLNNYPKGWQEIEVLNNANDFFQTMRVALEQDIASHLIDSFCGNAEIHLRNVLCELHFLVHYKMAVIKNIEVRQMKNLPPTRYKHKLVELDNNKDSVGEKDRFQELEESIDMDSVVLYQEKLSENLNLSPFILDEMALEGKQNSKIYFYSYFSEEGLKYEWLQNPTDVLKIRQDNLEYIQKQFDLARKKLLNEKTSSSDKSTVVDEDDIASFI